jgi:hypothetical protein
LTTIESGEKESFGFIKGASQLYIRPGQKHMNGPDLEELMTWLGVYYTLHIHTRQTLDVWWGFSSK